MVVAKMNVQSVGHLTKIISHFLIKLLYLGTGGPGDIVFSCNIYKEWLVGLMFYSS